MKKLTKVLSLMLVAALVLGTFAVPASAATKKTVKKQTFTTKTSTIQQKAATVQKGTTKLTIKKGQGYIKFVAPKSKKYSFTFSKLKSKNGVSAFIECQTKSKSNSSYSFFQEVKTKGGKTNTLWMSVNGYKDRNHKGVDKCLATRTATVKLSKGQAIFFYFYNGSEKTTCNLKIK